MSWIIEKKLGWKCALGLACQSWQLVGTKEYFILNTKFCFLIFK